MMRHEDVPGAFNALTESVIGAAMDVHSALGPGLVERLYEAALAHELHLRAIPFARQRSITLTYQGVQLGEQVVDLLVAECLVVELKSVETVSPIHLQQLVSNMRAGGWSVGLLINFNALRLKDGLFRRALTKGSRNQSHRPP
jgi:GxxExxY protein